MDGEQTIPTLYEWGGGEPAFKNLIETFYKRVPSDPIIGPVFAGMSPDHAQHVGAFITEVFGGPTLYSDAGGSHAEMVRHHFGRMLTEEQRQAWVKLLLKVADEVGLPTDPEFRSALVGYLEWGTRLAVINSQPDGSAPPDDAPMPKWGWGVPGGPYIP